MKLKINFKPYPGAIYFTVAEHKKAFDSINLKRSGDYEGSLQKNLRLLYHIPDDYKFYIINVEEKHLLINEGEGSDKLQAMAKDDPETGIDSLANSDSCKSPKEIDCLDLSYSFPNVLQDYSDFKNLVIDPNASLGIPSNYFFFFSQNTTGETLQELESVNMSRDDSEMYVLHKVVADYIEKANALHLRESNYKFAVLNQAIENSPHLKPIADKKNRSKTMLSAACSQTIIDKIENMGFDINAVFDGEKTRIIIANYPTHSKELVEMFSDRIAVL